MTQPNSTEPAGGQAQRRGRGPTKTFPSIPFEEAIVLPRSIFEHGVNGEIRRLTLLTKLERPPDSSMTRNLISGSYKYGLTTGSYHADSLTVTDEGRVLLDSNRPIEEIKRKEFELAIGQFHQFNSVYDRLKDKRLPDETVLKDEMGRLQVPDAQRQNAADVFYANIRYLGLVQPVGGSAYVRTIEEIVAQMPNNATNNPPKLPGIESSAEIKAPIEGNGKTAMSTNRPALHIDIQVHIDPTSSAEQIDQIFASMAKHLYGNES